MNPSIELGINRFDKVVSVAGCNADGEALAAALDIKYLDYDAALEQVLSSEAAPAMGTGTANSTAEATDKPTGRPPPGRPACNILLLCPPYAKKVR